MKSAFTESFTLKGTANIDSFDSHDLPSVAGKGHECSKGATWQWPLIWLVVTFFKSKLHISQPRITRRFQQLFCVRFELSFESSSIRFISSIYLLYLFLSFLFLFSFSFFFFSFFSRRNNFRNLASVCYELYVNWTGVKGLSKKSGWISSRHARDKLFEKKVDRIHENRATRNISVFSTWNICFSTNCAILKCCW